MNREKLIKAGIDYDEGLNRFAGKPELYEKYLRKLFSEDKVEILISQLESGDISAAFKTAHDLKGNSGNLSVSTLYKEIGPLVELLRAGDTPQNECMEAAQKVRRAYETARVAVMEEEND